MLQGWVQNSQGQRGLAVLVQGAGVGYWVLMEGATTGCKVLVLGASTGCKVLVLVCMLLVLVACSRSQCWVPIMGAGAGASIGCTLLVLGACSRCRCWVPIPGTGAGCRCGCWVPIPCAGARRWVCVPVCVCFDVRKCQSCNCFRKSIAGAGGRVRSAAAPLPLPLPLPPVPSPEAAQRRRPGAAGPRTARMPGP